MVVGADVGVGDQHSCAGLVVVVVVGVDVGVGADQQVSVSVSVQLKLSVLSVLVGRCLSVLVGRCWSVGVVGVGVVLGVVGSWCSR